MRRALEPTQRVSPDITYPEDPALAVEPVLPPAPVALKKSSENYWYLLVLLVLLFIASAAF
jgi:hypothetical protein